MAARPRVVVVGAGFAGLECAKRLVGEPVDVVLVDQNTFHTFQPLLYQVATSGLGAPDVAYPVRGIFQGAPNVAVRNGRVTHVDRGRREVCLAEGPPVPYDRLVLAAGASTSWFGIDGAEEHAFPLYGLDDAIALRNHVLACFEAADAEPARLDEGMLTFVVVGGGPTGVETAGALGELFSMVLAKDFRRLDVGRARVVLVERGPALLAPFSERARRHAHEQLSARGVELRLGTAVDRVEAGAVHLAGGESIASCTVVWAAGVRANPVADDLDLPQGDDGRIGVGADLFVPGHPEVLVVGDLAAIPDGHGGLLPQLAAVAKQSGRHAGEQLARATRGRPPLRFRYVDRGTMATIGRGSAVADLPFGLRLVGTPAWLAWLLLHLVLLAGFRNRMAVFVTWTWNYLTYDRGPRLIIRSDPRRPGRR